MRRILTAPALITVFLFLFAGQTAWADQYVANLQGKEVVVHSNPLPVIFHRLIPPNYGRHVTAREYRDGVKANTGARR